MAIWQRQPQDRDGSYHFSGHFYATCGIMESLSIEEILLIRQDIQSFVREKKSVDYLQVYMDETGRKLFFIDQLNQEMIESGEYEDIDNYCTLMLASEY